MHIKINEERDKLMQSARIDDLEEDKQEDIPTPKINSNPLHYHHKPNMMRKKDDPVVNKGEKEESPFKEITQPIKEDEWICEECTYINTLPDFLCMSIYIYIYIYI